MPMPDGRGGMALAAVFPPAKKDGWCAEWLAIPEDVKQPTQEV